MSSLNSKNMTQKDSLQSTSFQQDCRGLTEPHELFSRKIRESNIIFENNLSLAERLLNQETSHESIQMGTYCLEKAHEQRPYDIQVLEALISLKKM